MVAERRAVDGRKLSEHGARRHFSEQRVLAAPIDKADANFATDDEEYVLGRIVLSEYELSAFVSARTAFRSDCLAFICAQPL